MSQIKKLRDRKQFRMSIDIDELLHREIKVESAKRGISIKDFLISLIEEKLESYAEESIYLSKTSRNCYRVD